MSTDTFAFTGILKIREIPADGDEATFRHWWCDERNASGRLIRRAAMREREKDRRTVWEGQNMLMNAGRTQILTFMGQSSPPASFSQQYAVGTGAIYSVQPSDTLLASELFRLGPASFSIVGNAVTVSTVFSTSQGNGTWSNAGLFGVSASSTPNSGILMTHILCSYIKTSASAITSDYQMILT